MYKWYIFKFNIYYLSFICLEKYPSNLFTPKVGSDIQKDNDSLSSTSTSLK